MVRMAVASSERPTGQASVLSDGAALSLGSLIVSALALGLTNQRCSGDRSFDVFGPNVNRSGYCKALHVPAFPNSVSSVLIAAALFVLPAVIALLGTARSLRTQQPKPLRRAAALTVGILATSFALIPLAHVSYLGAG
jgi:hypothetical protein